jgi:RNase adaptor protein for sRNA GlmZ degradation
MNNNSLALRPKDFIEYICAIKILSGSDEINLDKFEDIVYDIKQNIPEDLQCIFSKFNFKKEKRFVQCPELRQEINFAQICGTIGNYRNEHNKQIIQLNKKEANNIVNRYQEYPDLYKVIYVIAMAL